MESAQSVSIRRSKDHIQTFEKGGANFSWASSSEFGTYRLCEQRRFRRACASAQSRQNLRFSLIQAVSQEEPSGRKPDPWPLWMAGHAQLKFVMTECSKTQIRLTRHSYFAHCFSCICMFILYAYRNVPKFSDREVLANNVDPDQTSPQGLHCLPFRQHLWTNYSVVKQYCSNFRVTTAIFRVSEF